MRILHVYRTYFPDPPGGIQEAIRHICLATQPLGVESRIFTFSPHPVPDVVRLPEGMVVRCRSWTAPASCDIGSADAFRRFRNLTQWADVIHYHFPWPFADLLHLAAGDKPAVLTYHSDIVRQRWLAKLYAPLMHHTLNKMRAVIATSPAYAATSPVLQTIVPTQRLRVIPLGMVDESARFPSLEKAGSDLLQRLGLKKNTYFLALGVLRYYKGLHTLVQAAASVNATVVIAGSGPENERLQALAAQIGARNVVFTGQVSKEEKFALIRGCRALILPSHLRSEAFGMVLIEASMCGRPMICCEVGSGTSFVNQHEVTGLVVPPEYPGKLAQAMNRLLADEALAERMGHAARERYQQWFSGEALGNAHVELYKMAAGTVVRETK